MKSQLFPSRILSVTLRATLPVIALATLLCAGLPLQAGAVPEEGSRGSDDIVAIVRAPAPKDLLPKLMSVARQVQPGAQVEALPFILGGMLGDPMLTGISATENFGVILIAAGDDIVPVLVLNLPEASPWRQSLRSYQMTVKDQNGWSFAVPEGVSLSHVEGREASLIAAVRGARRYDVEMVLNVQGLGGKLQEGVGAFAGDLPLFVQSIVQAAAGEVEAMRDVRVGLNFSRDAVEQAYYLQAAPGTALAAFLDQKRPANLDFARFIEADAALTFLGGIDSGAARTYLNHLAGQFREKVGEEAPEGWEKIVELMDRFLRSTNGASGGTLSLDGMVPQMISVSPTTLSDEELVGLINPMTELAKRLMGEAAGEAAGLVYLFTPNAATIDETPIHHFRTEVSMPEEQAEMMRDLPGMPATAQDAYYAVVGNHLVNTSDLDDMRKTIEALQKGEPVANNVAARIAIRDESLFEFQIDLVRYFGGVMTAMMPGGLGETFQELEKQKLAPVQGILTARGGEGEMKLSIPVETIVAGFQAFSSMMMQQQEMFSVPMEEAP